MTRSPNCRHGSKILNYRVMSDRQRYYINQTNVFNSIPDLLTHYHHYPLNSATGSKLVTPVSAGPETPHTENGEYVTMEKKPGHPTLSH